MIYDLIRGNWKQWSREKSLMIILCLMKELGEITLEVIWSLGDISWINGVRDSI